MYTVTKFSDNAKLFVKGRFGCKEIMCLGDGNVLTEIICFSGAIECGGVIRVLTSDFYVI